MASEAARYCDLPPDQFLTRWLLCGPFPLREGEGPADETVRRQGFERDFLAEHGGETTIHPAPGLAHRLDGDEVRWQLYEGTGDRIDLDSVYGRQEEAVVYGWAEIDVPTATTVLLGIGSDDAVKLWLNGALIHENWVFRPVSLDQDLVLAPLRAGKNQLLFKLLNGDGPWGFACRPLGLGQEGAGRLLLTAAGENRTAVAEFLIARGAAVDARDPEGRTPLHRAAENGHRMMAALLLGRGAAIDAAAPGRLTPLHLARRAGFDDVAELLLARGADPRRRPASRSKQLDTLFSGLEGAPGAAVMVIHRGRVLHAGGYGLADLERAAPVRPDTPFYLASVGKQFTAMAIMLLAEEGRLRYDDPLHQFLPEFPDYGRGITLRHLLHHTSGIPDYLNDRLAEDATDITNAQVLELLKRQAGLKFSPGERFGYSNSGYTLLSMIAAQVSGRPFHEFMRERIFVPLGMKNTRVYDESRPAIAGRARGYSREGEDYQLSDYRLLTTGDGGIFSTVEDLFHWDQALSAERLVSRATLQEAFTPARTSDGSATGYGFGWQLWSFRGLKAVSHSGGNAGFRTNILRIPDERFTVIFLANNGTVAPHTMSERIAEIYLAGRMEPRPRDRTGA